MALTSPPLKRLKLDADLMGKTIRLLTISHDYISPCDGKTRSEEKVPTIIEMIRSAGNGKES